MQLIGDVFSTIFVAPTINLLAAIFHALTFLHIPSPLGFSIIILTVLIRFILYPITAAQLKTAKKMQEVAPKLNKLKDMHKNDAKKLQEETMRLYKEHGVNPAAGCIPLLVQLPIIWGLYSVLQNIVKASASSYINHAAYLPALQIHTKIDTTFFGLPLGVTPSHIFASAPLILLVPLLTAGFQFIQAKMMAPAIAAEGAIEKEAQREKGELTKEKKKQDDFQTAFQTQSLYIFPLMIGFFSWTLPVGLSFYWNTFTIFGIIQQYKISGPGGVSSWLVKIKKYGK